MDGTTAHRLLGTAPAASSATIRSTYRQLAKRHHPDRGGDPAAFRLLHQAYRTAVTEAKVQPSASAHRFYAAQPAPPRRPTRSFAEELRLAMGL